LGRELKMSRSDEAGKIFRNGFNCSQAVFSVFAAKNGIQVETAMKIACAFGGGMRLGNTCGAVTGALMAIGLKYGKSKTDDNHARDRTYALTKQFQEKFRDMKGSLMCRDLLGYDLSTKEGYEKAKENQAFLKICPGLVEDAVTILEEIIKTEEDSK
jgi:C_GCAxxG_C_C family probable redox protein